MTQSWPDIADPLQANGQAERVNYATGLMLDAEDFLAEQTYHRSRLARLVQALVGHGTLAGLAVNAPSPGDPSLEIRVEPGIAADRLGRLIEVAHAQCLRLARWYEQQDDAPLLAAMSTAPDDPAAHIVTCDVFLAAHGCARGHSPAFASGSQNAIDATVPSRLEERGELSLVLRPEAGDDAIPAPHNSWPGEGETTLERLAAVLGSWPSPAELVGPDGGLPALDEHVAGVDPASLLLARIAIPVEAPATGEIRPRLRLDAPVRVDNSLRPFVFLPGKWLGSPLRPIAPVQP
jgi:hypothetical protein